MTRWLVFGLGFLAQALFSSRIILQWIVSEKHKKVLTPRLFWEISLAASCLLFIYGYLRDDFAIMLGQILTYCIYIRNIQIMHEWERLPRGLRIFIFIFPVAFLVYGFNNGMPDRVHLFQNKDIPLPLMIFGIAAQVLFTLRFVYQWWYSESVQESKLPMGFWTLSLAGSLLIFIYAIFRRDPVLFIANLAGMIIYSRNIVLLKKYG